MSIGETLIQALSDRLAEDPLFAPGRVPEIPVVPETDLQLTDRTDKALGSIGICVVVLITGIQWQGMQADYHFTIRVIENVAQNRGKTGSKVVPLLIGEKIKGLLQGWCPGEEWSEILPSQFQLAGATDELMIWELEAVASTVSAVDPTNED